MVCTGCSYPLRHRRWPWIALGTRILFMVAMCIQIDGFVLLKVAGSIKTVHERGISLSGTWRMLEEAFNAGAEISVQLIFLGTLEELLFASMGQNMASSDGTTSTTARWSSSASFLSSPDDFSKLRISLVLQAVRQCFHNRIYISPSNLQARRCMFNTMN